MVGNGWVRAPLKRGSYSLCGAPFLPPSNTPPALLEPLSTVRNAIQWSSRTNWMRRGLVGLVRWTLAWDGRDVSRTASGASWISSQPLQILAPAADLLHHSLEPMESRDAKTSLRAIFAMIIYQIILDAGALPRIRDAACRAGISAKFFL
jgi:hypothetical protein